VASVEYRERVDKEGNVKVSYVVRWRDPGGAPKSKSVAKKVWANRYRDTIAADLVRGQYIDPQAGKVTVKEYCSGWLEAQTFDRSTYEAVALRLRLHVYPVLGSKRMNQVKPSTIQSWLRGLSHLSLTYQRTIYANLSTVFTAAVDDEIIPKNPCRAASVRKPKPDLRKLVPWEKDWVLVRDTLPVRYQIVPTIGAGLGMRQGEIFGVSPDDIDFAAGEVEVRRQVKLFAGSKLVFARTPQGAKDSDGSPAGSRRRRHHRAHHQVPADRSHAPLGDSGRRATHGCTDPLLPREEGSEPQLLQHVHLEADA
jgi:integrase